MEVENVVETPKKRNTKNKEQPVTEQATTDNSSYEFNSMRDIKTGLELYLGVDLIDLYGAEQLSAIVRDPIAHYDILREISLMLYSANGIYTNTVDYMTAMPTLDKIIVAHGKSKEKKRRNKEIVTSTLRTVKDKEFIRDALMRGMLEGVAFYYFETNNRPKNLQKMMTDYEVDRIVEINSVGMNASIISLPAKYTEIVGTKNGSYVIAFNLDYFDEAGGETSEKKLKKYPKEIRDAYEHRNVYNEEHGRWVVLDSQKTIVHKIRSTKQERYGRPLVLAAISDILYSDYFTNTKRNVLNEINNKIVYQTFPEGKDKGTCALTKAQQQAQHDTVKNAVLSKNNRGGISFFSVASGTKIDTVDTSNIDIFDDKYESNRNENIAAALGFAGSLLTGTGSGSYSAQTNNLELISAQLFQWIDQIESELNKCINAGIVQDANNWTEVRYLKTTYVNREKTVTFAKDLYLQGKGPLSLWASACGVSPDVFFAMLDQEIEDNVENKYPVHATSFTTSGNNDDKGGRPEDPESQNPNTLQSRSNNSNDAPKPSTK